MVTLRLGRDDWIDEGLRTLMRSGVEAVRVEPLARALKVTKGSFYWHFADRTALLEAMRAAWKQRATDNIVATVEEASGMARQRLARLFDLVARNDNRLERAVRNWAALDAATSAIVDDVDRRRMDYLTRLFLELGHASDGAAARARLCYHAYVGQFAVADPRTPEQRLAEWHDVILPLIVRRAVPRPTRKMS